MWLIYPLAVQRPTHYISLSFSSQRKAEEGSAYTPQSAVKNHCFSSVDEEITPVNAMSVEALCIWNTINFSIK